MPYRRAPWAVAAILATAVVGIDRAAPAAEVIVSAFAAQRFEVNDNPDLDQDGDTRFASLTDVGASFLIETPRTEVILSPGARLSAFTGDDADVRLDPNLAARFRRRGARDDLFGAFRVLPRFIEDGDFDDGGSDGSGFEIVVGGDLGWRRRVDPRNQLSLTAFGELREPVDGDDLTATRSYGASGGWTHALDSATSLGLSGGYRRFESDDDDEEDRDILDLAVSADHAVNQRLSLGASVGPSFVFGEDGGVGVSAGVAAGYAYPDTRLSFSFDQAVDQDSDGEIDNVSRFTAGLSHDINARSRAGVTAGLALRTPFISGDGDDEQTLSLSPRYSHAITPNWSLSAGYTLRLRFDDDGEATSNMVFISLSRALSRAPAF